MKLDSLQVSLLSSRIVSTVLSMAIAGGLGTLVGGGSEDWWVILLFYLKLDVIQIGSFMTHTIDC